AAPAGRAGRRDRRNRAGTGQAAAWPNRAEAAALAEAHGCIEAVLLGRAAAPLSADLRTSRLRRNCPDSPLGPSSPGPAMADVAERVSLRCDRPRLRALDDLFPRDRGDGRRARRPLPCLCPRPRRNPDAVVQVLPEDRSDDTSFRGA